MQARIDFLLNTLIPYIQADLNSLFTNSTIIAAKATEYGVTFPSSYGDTRRIGALRGAMQKYLRQIKLEIADLQEKLYEAGL